MITVQEVLMGREVAAPLTPELQANLNKLMIALNKLRFFYGKPMTVSSGYRPPAINAKVPGAAKRSAHMTCEACDFRDPTGELDAWCLANLHRLEECGLYLESPEHTPNWCHVQIRKPKSGNRVFLP